MTSADTSGVTRPVEPAEPRRYPGGPGANSAYSARAIVEEFDRRDRELPAAYNGWHDPSHQFFQAQTARELLRALVREREFPLDEKRILDVGCGSGGWLLEFARWGADPAKLSGVDLNPRRLSQARRRLPLAELREGDARDTAWPRGHFDIVTQFTLFCSVPFAGIRREIAVEMLRVLRPGGLILSYDLRVSNPSNAKVGALPKTELRSLFPDCRMTLCSLTLAPPLARRIVPVSWTLALLLERLPFVRTHYLAVIRKPLVAAH